jgi:hypothetical protein
MAWRRRRRRSGSKDLEVYVAGMKPGKNNCGTGKSRSTKYVTNY